MATVFPCSRAGSVLRLDFMDLTSFQNSLGLQGWRFEKNSFLADPNFETTLFRSCLNFSWSFLLPLLCALLKRRFLFQINCTISLFNQGKLCLVGRIAFGIQESIMSRNELLRLDQLAWISFSTKISSKSRSQIMSFNVDSFEIGILVSPYILTNKRFRGNTTMLHYD